MGEQPAAPAPVAIATGGGPRSEAGPQAPPEGLWEEAQGERLAGVPRGAPCPAPADGWSPLAPAPRVPLRRAKSLRQSLKEHGLLEQYLKLHPYDPAAKYFPSLFSSEPLQNYMDVSMAGQRGWRWRGSPRGHWPLTRPPNPLAVPLPTPLIPCPPPVTDGVLRRHLHR